MILLKDRKGYVERAYSKEEGSEAQRLTGYMGGASSFFFLYSGFSAVSGKGKGSI